jgi:hypothetical protein
MDMCGDSTVAAVTAGGGNNWRCRATTNEYSRRQRSEWSASAQGKTTEWSENVHRGLHGPLARWVAESVKLLCHTAHDRWGVEHWLAVTVNITNDP